MKLTFAIALVVVGLMSAEAIFRKESSNVEASADVKFGNSPLGGLLGVVGGAVKNVVSGTIDFLNPENNVKKDGCIFKSPEILSKLFQKGKTCKYRGKDDDGEEVEQFTCPFKKQSGSINYCKGSEGKSGKISESASQIDIVEKEKVTATVSSGCPYCLVTKEVDDVISNADQFVNNTIQQITKVATFDCNKPFLGHQERIEMEKKYPCMSMCKGKQVIVGSKCGNSRAPSTGCKKMQTVSGGCKNQFIVAK